MRMYKRRVRRINLSDLRRSLNYVVGRTDLRIFVLPEPTDGSTERAG